MRSRPVSARAALLLGALCLAAAARAATPGDAMPFTPAQRAAIARHSPLPPPPPGAEAGMRDPARAARLGQALFFDTQLSRNGTVACASCHDPAKAFTDRQRVATALDVGERNTPTLLNAAYGHWFFWDGRADSLWAQALGPIENPKEFGGNRLDALRHVAGTPPLRQAYEAAFGLLPPLEDTRRFPLHGLPASGAPTRASQAWAAMAPADQAAANRAFANLGKAFEAYERKLMSQDSPFDRFAAALRTSDMAAQALYPAAARRGLALFVGRANCELCHSGPTFSDGAFHNLGLPTLEGRADPGRSAGIATVLADGFNANGPFAGASAAAGKEFLAYLPEPQSQLGAFKTPSLRNVALTAPYGHDGRFATLAEVLAFYANGAAAEGPRVGERERTLDLVPRLTAAQQADLAAFLETLTGAPVPAELTVPPDAP